VSRSFSAYNRIMKGPLTRAAFEILTLDRRHREFRSIPLPQNLTQLGRRAPGRAADHALKNPLKNRERPHGSHAII
jgi:hypothetical protein